VREDSFFPLFLLEVIVFFFAKERKQPPLTSLFLHHSSSPPLFFHQKRKKKTVWEHAYYPVYENRRPEYIGVFVNELINWDKVAERFAAAGGK
jgi:hypothetical protein